MEKNYYDETVEKIKLLIEEKKYEQAYALVSSELDLPYVPENYLPQFQELKLSLIEWFKNSNQKNLNFSIEEILKIIENDEKVLLGYALSALENIALINFLDKLVVIFAKPQLSLEIKGLIYEVCVKQQINKGFEIDGQKINPVKNGSIGLQPQYDVLWQAINAKCNKDQSIINVAYFIYNKYLIINFVKFLTNQLDLDVVDNIYELTLLFMRQKTVVEISEKSRKMMDWFK